MFRLADREGRKKPRENCACAEFPRIRAELLENASFGDDGSRRSRRVSRSLASVASSAPSVYLCLLFGRARQVHLICHSTADKIRFAGRSESEEEENERERMLLYTLIGGYMLTSVILFKYPTLLHKKKRVKFLCQHISHRGGESSFPPLLLPFPLPHLCLPSRIPCRVRGFFFDMCDINKQKKDICDTRMSLLSLCNLINFCCV